MTKILIAVAGMILLILASYWQGNNYGKNKAENTCKTDQLKAQAIDSQNNVKIIKQNVQVIQRKAVNIVIPVSDDLIWLRQNYNTGKNS